LQNINIHGNTRISGNLSSEDGCFLEENGSNADMTNSTSEGVSTNPLINNPEINADFATLGLPSPLLDSIYSLGWTVPSPVQAECLPLTLRGDDIAGFAQTGTGKTGVFLITIADKILRAREGSGYQRPFAVILVPTRELAIQIQQDAEGIFKTIDINTLAIFGGMDYEKQMQDLRKDVDVIVATPGRLRDFHQKNLIPMKNCSVFVCDEADRMLEMGFIQDVEYFFSRVSDTAQKLFFSATTNDRVKVLANRYLRNPHYIEINPEVTTPEKINQRFIISESKDKLKVLLGFLKTETLDCAIIFTNTKAVAQWLHFKLSKNDILAHVITGDLPQKKRVALIEKIKEGKIKVLIATDVASRGLHIPDVTHVFNFDLPDDPSNYIHRIGRTARAGTSGIAISLVCEDYGHNLEGIQEKLHPTKKIECEWYKSEFDAIVDKAPNPYKLKDTDKDKEGFDDSRKKPVRRGSEKSRPSDRRPSESNPRSGASARPAAGGQERDRERQRGPRKPQSKGPGRPREQVPMAAAASGAKRPGKPVAQQEAPATVTGLLKKMIKSIFGKG
jgi:ATP-dependent RNA helicase RhlB